jgi:hypothetical protein
MMIIVFSYIVLQLYQAKEDEMGKACSMHARGRRMHIGFWWESEKKREGRQTYVGG